MEAVEMITIHDFKHFNTTMYPVCMYKTSSFCVTVFGFTVDVLVFNTIGIVQWTNQ